jgi:hypothetical protein
MIGSYCELHKETPVTDLRYGMDFREPKYRREVFLRFYEFHLIHRTHPGCVYFAFPWLQKHYGLDEEQMLWMAFINGCSQNIVTTDLIFQRFPDVMDVDLHELNTWWNEIHTKLKVGGGWDLDRRYFKIGKTGFPACVERYQTLVRAYGSQTAMFKDLCRVNDKYQNYRQVWKYVRECFITFGRLSAFSYIEYLRIVGLNVDCDELYLDDIKGSRSHRNGICKVLGRDDLDWWKDTVEYDDQTILWLTGEGAKLLQEAKERIDHKDVSYFTLESTLCNYKSWHRPDRRYPNVYADMFHDRIKYAESQWGNQFDIFWQMRDECLPDDLLLEKNPCDVGVTKIKQNHYRLTGQPVMMDTMFNCFKNEYNDLVRSTQLKKL